MDAAAGLGHGLEGTLLCSGSILVADLGEGGWWVVVGMVPDLPGACTVVQVRETGLDRALRELEDVAKRCCDSGPSRGGGKDGRVASWSLGQDLPTKRSCR